MYLLKNSETRKVEKHFHIGYTRNYIIHQLKLLLQRLQDIAFCDERF
jgi:hypothetical protein